MSALRELSRNPKPSSFVLQRAAGERILLDAKSGPHKLARGDRLDMITAGGGGWGKKV